GVQAVRFGGILGAGAAVVIAATGVVCAQGAFEPEDWLDTNAPTDQCIAFALYTVHVGTLKLTAQLYPLADGVERTVELRARPAGSADPWRTVATTVVDETSYGWPDEADKRWTAHFRVGGWDQSLDFDYRVAAAGGAATFDGLIRKDPEGPEIVVASMSCNSNAERGPRDDVVRNLRHQDPDLLFFAGDQSYDHKQHLEAWLLFGRQFREIMRDRPTITIPDDHDIGQGNLWGQDGKRSYINGNSDGGYFYPVEYVNMVQRQQTWHLPDPVDAAPIDRGITVYFTRLTLGGVDFAIIEDRKFKTGPQGKIPQQGPRPDHITDTSYDPKSIDLPGLQLLGDRQMKFLRDWGQDWTAATMKAVLSQTAFCGAVHMHGKRDDRLLADLDCNGWPQSPRNLALEEIRRAWAVHLCGDQHLAVVVKHGVEAFGDGPYAFTSPAIVNTVYGRWWHPLDEQPGPEAVDGPLPWTGNYLDGLGNRISMLAYANPEDVRDERKRGDGYGIVRIDKKRGIAHVECWPRFSDPEEGDSAQFPGWPIDLELRKNDGRRVHATLDPITEPGVVQVVRKEDGEVLYTLRVKSGWRPPVFGPGTYTVKFGADRPERILIDEHVVL
ncbi:MAG: hypothetical protein KDC95_14225, partial [Planctomycetes bacterium]|nr:hypothetical protein [Planctomycetota bacterium]